MEALSNTTRTNREHESNPSEDDINERVFSDVNEKERAYEIRDTQGIPASFDPLSIPTPTDYVRLYWNCMALKGELMRFSYSLRCVGSSGPGIYAVNVLNLKLRSLRDLLGINTLALFPEDQQLQVFSELSSPSYVLEVSKAFREFSDAIDMLAKALRIFSDDYNDDKFMLMLFCLQKRFLSDGEAVDPIQGVISSISPEELQLRIQQFISWVDMAVQSLASSVGNFSEKGIPAICSAQQYRSSSLLNMTTIATFLSGATVSMLQISIGETSTPTGIATNTFLFSSLVFSISSAVTSLLVIAWSRSFVRSPRKLLPPLMGNWFNTAPMACLLISGALFVISLCLFAFASGQNSVTSGITVALSAFHTTVLILLFGWFLWEKWEFRQETGAVGQDLLKDSFFVTLIDWLIGWLECLKPDRRQQAEVVANDIGRKEFPISSMGNTSYSDANKPEDIQNALSDETFLISYAYAYEEQAHSLPETLNDINRNVDHNTRMSYNEISTDGDVENSIDYDIDENGTGHSGSGKIPHRKKDPSQREPPGLPHHRRIIERLRKLHHDSPTRTALDNYASRLRPVVSPVYDAAMFLPSMALRERRRNVKRSGSAPNA